MFYGDLLFCPIIPRCFSKWIVVASDKLALLQGFGLRLGPAKWESGMKTSNASNNSVVPEYRTGTPGDAEKSLLLPVRGVADLLKISVAHVWRLTAADPTFPVPVRIGRSTRWRREEVASWVAGLPAGGR